MEIHMLHFTKQKGVILLFSTVAQQMVVALYCDDDPLNLKHLRSFSAIENPTAW
jgi:hypothetical protein